jgi:hypothetical protein
MASFKVKFTLDSGTILRTFKFDNEKEKEAFLSGMWEIVSHKINQYEIIPEEVKIATITASSFEELELVHGTIILQIPNKEQDCKILPKLISIDEATLEERKIGIPYVQVNGSWTKADVINRT